MGMGRSCPGPIRLVWKRSQRPARAPRPQVFPGHSASAGVGDLLGSVIHEKTRGPLGGREAFQFPRQEPRDPVNVAWYLKGGARSSSGASGGGHALLLLGPESGPETSQPGLGQKPSPGCLSHVLPSFRRVPRTNGKTGGYSHSGQRDGGGCGFPALRPVARTPVPGVRAPWRQRAAYGGMQGSFGG